MTKTQIERVVSQYAELYPPLITMREAGQIARVATKTVQNWATQGVLEPIRFRVGAQSLLARDGFVRYILNGDHGKEPRAPIDGSEAP